MDKRIIPSESTTWNAFVGRRLQSGSRPDDQYVVVKLNDEFYFIRLLTLELLPIDKFLTPFDYFYNNYWHWL